MNKERIERTVKLNLDFSLYKGKTRLKHWWPKVKEHFTQVQTAHNALEDTVSAHKTASELDHPSKSVKQRHIADRAVGQGQIADYAVGQGQLAQYAVSSAKIYPAAVQTAHIKDGNVTREKLSEDITAELDKITPTQQKLNEEITKLRATDATLATRITDEAMDRIDGDDGVRNNIEQQLYNKNVRHTFKVVLPIGIPQLYFSDGQEYEGEYLRLPDLDIKLYFDGKLLEDIVLMTRPVNIPVNRSDSYVHLAYYFDDASVYISASENPVQAYIDEESVHVPLYHYENINLDFWPDDNSPSGDHYGIEGYGSEYSSENTDKAGSTYTVEQGYSEVTGNSLANLKTDSKTSFLDAVNELSDKVDTIEDISAAQKDLYGDAAEQTAGLDIEIMSEELSQHTTGVTTDYVETDIFEVVGDISLDIDDHGVFNTANTSDLKSWNINSKFKIYETPDYQPIAICFDIDKKKVWVEKTYDNSYNNGVFKFHIADVEHPHFFPNSDGSYTVDYSYLFINGALGHTRTTLIFNDIRSRWQIEMGSNFLDAVNNNTARLNSKVDKVNGKGLSTNDYTNADKAKLDNSPVWNQNKNCPNEYDTDATIEVNELYVNENNLYFNSNGYLSIYEVTDAINSVTEMANSKTRAATIVVGTSTSGHTGLNVDYPCDGADDQEQINAAIAALPPSGGKIVLLEGTYNISNRIDVNKNNVTIEGMGIGATTLQTDISLSDVIRVLQPYATLRNFSIDCTLANPQGIGIRLANNGSHALVENVKIEGFAEGIHVASNYFTLINKIRTMYCTIGMYINSSNTNVTNCVIIDSEEIGIKILGKRGYICGNYIFRGTGQTSDYTETQYTISVQNGQYNEISNNYILGKNYIETSGTGNTFVNNRYQ
ncbi:MAG: hypothetical protein HFE49_04610 [Clostridia bacterium]|nr:hypothetical protein [Clostridia bacterium]